MAKKITATEAVRHFSEVLSAVTYRGARYVILRGGKPVAEIHPVAGRIERRLLQDLPEILGRIPALGNDVVAFDRDLRWVIAHQPSMPKSDAWE